MSAYRLGCVVGWDEDHRGGGVGSVGNLEGDSAKAQTGDSARAAHSELEKVGVLVTAEGHEGRNWDDAMRHGSTVAPVPRACG